MYGLRVGVGPAEVDLSRLASGDAVLFEGQEQDLSGAFPAGAVTVESLGSAIAAGTGLRRAQAGVRLAFNKQLSLEP